MPFNPAYYIFIMKLSKVLFWDTDYSKIDWEKQANAVISRVSMNGNWDDWRTIKTYYGLERIKTELLKTRYLDDKTLNFFSIIFNLPKEKFRCYTMKQSIQELWNY